MIFLRSRFCGFKIARSLKVFGFCGIVVFNTILERPPFSEKRRS